MRVKACLSFTRGHRRCFGVVNVLIIVVIDLYPDHKSQAQSHPTEKTYVHANPEF